MSESERTCVSCGRRMEPRRRWRDDPDRVRYCSQACRRRGVRPVDRDLEQAIIDLLATRSREATICPSAAARAVGGEDWRPLMEPTRRAARRLVARGELEIVQGGRPIDPSTARGPIRLRRPRSG